MNSFPKINSSRLNYILLLLILFPIFGFKFFIGILGNILLLFLLLLVLLIIVSVMGLNSLKNNVKVCNQCGPTFIGANENCLNCGAKFEKNINELNVNASEKTIEIEAEEIK